MEDEKVLDDFAQSISELLGVVLNEEVMILKMEKFLSPSPPQLANTKEESDLLNKDLQKLSKALGGTPQLMIISHSDNRIQKYDEYGSTALSEVLSLYDRARYSLVKTHLLMIAKWFLRDKPNIWEQPFKEEELKFFQAKLEQRFWQEAENCYIRLASYWDRVGQLFDFVFFNIRHYDREGFSSVMDKINSNFVPVFSELNESESWLRLRQYQASDKVDGFKWLVRRRNLLVHSLHLRTMPESDYEDPIVVYAFNHLEEKMRKKLTPGSEQDEVGYLHSHFGIMTELFRDVIKLSFLAVNLGVYCKIHNE